MLVRVLIRIVYLSACLLVHLGGHIVALKGDDVDAEDTQASAANDGGEAASRVGISLF